MDLLENKTGLILKSFFFLGENCPSSNHLFKDETICSKHIQWYNYQLHESFPPFRRACLRRVELLATSN